MRVVYRISPEKHAHDLSGEGSRLHGARWNKKGTAVIYTAESRALAVLESLVHVSLPNLPAGLKVVSLGIPDSIVPKEIDPSRLPELWRTNPPPFALADIGTDWVVSGESLLLRVPSVVVPDEFTIIINPRHHNMKQIKLLEAVDFVFDERLHKKGK